MIKIMMRDLIGTKDEWAVAGILLGILSVSAAIFVAVLYVWSLAIIWLFNLQTPVGLVMEVSIWGALALQLVGFWVASALERSRTTPPNCETGS